MTVIYFIIGIFLSLIVGIFAVRHEQKQSSAEKAAARLPYLKFVRFISSWKVFFALLIPSIAIDYLFSNGEPNFLLWFFILYGFFILPLSYSYHRPPYFRKLDIFHSAGKRRMEAYGSQDSKIIEGQQKRNQLKWILILSVVAIFVLYRLIIGL